MTVELIGLLYPWISDATHCSYPGCSELVPDGQTYCSRTHGRTARTTATQPNTAEVRE